jgi:acyl carrier protein
MTKRDRLLRLVADLFQTDADHLSLDMRPGDLPRWDSLGHISLLEAAQREFAVEIPLEAGLGVESLQDLLDAIEDASS